MRDFVARGSIVRSIWGDADVILLVFAGSAAEFALNRAVDWLFFTGGIPRDPIGRLFSTARFAQDIVFVDEDTARRTLDRIRGIHEAVEAERGGRIPDWANRDVLYMLIDYSERAFALLHRPLDPAERRELYDVFRRVGEGLRIPDLPATYAQWRTDRIRHLERDLAWSEHTSALYAAYRRQLGPVRYRLLREVQAILAPEHVREQLRLASKPAVRAAVRGYRLLARLGLRRPVQWLLMPHRHLADLRRLDHAAPASDAAAA